MKRIKQNIYSKEFKESTVKLAIESKVPIAQTARELGIKVNTLYGWLSKYSNHPKATISGKGDDI